MRGWGNTRGRSICALREASCSCRARFDSSKLPLRPAKPGSSSRGSQREVDEARCAPRSPPARRTAPLHSRRASASRPRGPSSASEPAQLRRQRQRLGEARRAARARSRSRRARRRACGRQTSWKSVGGIAVPSLRRQRQALRRDSSYAVGQRAALHAAAAATRARAAQARRRGVAETPASARSAVACRASPFSNAQPTTRRAPWPCANVDRIVDPRAPCGEIGVAELCIQRGRSRCRIAQSRPRRAGRAARGRCRARPAAARSGRPSALARSCAGAGRAPRAPAAARRAARRAIRSRRCAPRSRSCAEQPSRAKPASPLAVGELHARRHRARPRRRGARRGAARRSRADAARSSPCSSERHASTLSIDGSTSASRPSRIEDAHVEQIDLRPQPEPAGLDARRCVTGWPTAARHRGDDVAAVALDVGQQPEAHGEHQRREGEKRRPGENFDRSPQPLHGGINVQSAILILKCRNSIQQTRPFALRRGGCSKRTRSSRAETRRCRRLSRAPRWLRALEGAGRRRRSGAASAACAGCAAACCCA